MGPLLGSLLASGFYHLLCYVRWEGINPGQDYNEWEVKARQDSSGPSEHTMTDPIHYGNGNYSSTSPVSPGNENVNGTGHARHPMAETSPEQQV